MSQGKQSREWDAASYHRVSSPQVSWGEKVLARLSLKGNESVLDAGCGTGRLTANLVAALPHGHVIAVDLSENMLRQARAHLASVDRVHFAVADFVDLPFQRSLDGIFSTASFHWVLDHRRLFQSLLGALRPGGWLVAQCGGIGNLARLRARMDRLSQTAPYRAFLSGFREPWFFSDAETAALNLQQAGFNAIETSIEPALTPFDDADRFIQFLRTSVVHRHLDRLPDTATRNAFLRALADEAAHDKPAFELDYWRLNLKAQRPEA